jgi:hypothetical protein
MFISYWIEHLNVKLSEVSSVVVDAIISDDLCEEVMVIVSDLSCKMYNYFAISSTMSIIYVKCTIILL